MLLTTSEVQQRIESGKPLLCAGSQEVLQTLPKGNWIGGSTPYFMDKEGGEKNFDKIFVTELPEDVGFTRIETYGVSDLHTLVENSSDNGITFLLIPAFSEIHKTYAKEALEMPGLFEKKIIGWVTGFDLDQPHSAKVFNGQTGEVLEDKAIVMQTILKNGKTAEIKIKNIFEQGDGDVITFEKSDFECEDCFINGEKQHFAAYLKENNIDMKLPLVADFFGALVNVSFMEAEKKVKFYAPVFDNVDYKIAKPVENYVDKFNKILSDDKNIVFSCNCILNYLYGELENKKTGSFFGPITFGEIAYQVLNQTLVYVVID